MRHEHAGIAIARPITTAELLGFTDERGFITETLLDSLRGQTEEPVGSR